MDQSKELAVSVQNGCKNYGHFWNSTRVLHDITLNVPIGIIYGLLGPSGCGKTTLLRCIVGRFELNSGEILLFGKHPGSYGHEIPGRSVGYMPQENALYKNFSISEMLHYFGRLHHMSKKEILSRVEFLIHFLDLPLKTRKVAQLSGGQQRRVSLACALLQQPKLLILDEPTVGVDPLLREKIWTHLIEICQSSQTTIIITTHYIEEARKANRVGLMRSGRMLAEDEPLKLLNQYNQTSLENVFLHLCFNDQNRIERENLPISFANPLTTEVNTDNFLPMNTNQIKKSSKPKKILRDYLVFPKLHKILALIIKDLTVIKTNIGFLFFQFLIPVIQVSLFCLCIGRDPKALPMALFNNESLNNFPTGNESLQLLSQINSDQIHFNSFNNFDQALNSVKQGRYWGLAEIRTNFTEAINDKFFKFQTDPLTLNTSSIHLYLDMTNQQVTFTMQNVILNGTEMFLKRFLSEHGFDPSIVNPPVIIENPIYGSLTPKFLNFAAPGMMISVIYFLAL
ncbi:unnamed protein product [Adineta ricciae]|uniref:ABC transporter domain-containing protein n=1 Tax=Adineta ricciae TaxID=249248 RepID=A0A815KI38_ADIRI|nr:unnamed protein product [Adineta ricciae]